MEEQIKLLVEYNLIRDMLQSVSGVLEQQYMQWAHSRQQQNIQLINDEFKSPLQSTLEKLTGRFAELRLELSKSVDVDIEAYFVEPSAIIT